MTLANRMLQNFKILYTVNENFRNDTDKKSVEVVSLFDADKSANDLRLRYNLSRSYQDVIKSHLFFKKIPEHLIVVGTGSLSPFVINDPRNKKEKIVVLPLVPELTLTEIQNSWEDIKSFRDILLKDYIGRKKQQKTYPKNKLDRDIEIYKSVLPRQSRGLDELGRLKGDLVPVTLLVY